VEGSCEHGNEPSGSIKCWEVLEQMHNWRLLKKDSAQRSKFRFPESELLRDWRFTANHFVLAPTPRVHDQ
jgi:hypothetical protein